MKDFNGRIAVITGGGTGMGRELARQLTHAGCHVAFCDVSADNMAETAALCRQDAPAGVRITTHLCDVADEAQVLNFRDAVQEQHDTAYINLLFNNAGIGGGGSFVVGEREQWERTFGVCWYGVYYCTRAFMPLLVASESGYLVNTSSVNGFWATLGPGVAHTAYSAAKFAVKGFSEALINDLRLNAPHVKVAVVMPGHIGTSIAINTGRILGQPDPLDLPATEVARAREQMVRLGMPVGNEPDDAIRAFIHQRQQAFRDNAPTTAASAATVILDGVRNERWRILVGDDAYALDRHVRAAPEEAYEPEFLSRINAEGHLRGVTSAPSGSASPTDTSASPTEPSA
jgi:NAD(P)-dependent dehydrogenase (short-subunit alcohol dehydrogenase family)